MPRSNVRPTDAGGTRWQVRISRLPRTGARSIRSAPRSTRWRASSGSIPARGLSAEEARSRLASHGPNRLAAGKKEPGWRAFLRQYEDFMQVILLAAALVNQVVTGDTGTTVVLAGLTVFNAVIGLRQESKAEESVKALRR